jgi:hypothetical protein
MMKDWLKALVSETFFSVWWFLSAVSTVSTFFFHRWSGKPLAVSAFSTIVGFAWANFRVFQKRQKRVAELETALASHEARTSQLRITPDGRSRYILSPVANVPRADFNGGFLLFELMIENVGRRNSIVNSYQIEIDELHHTFENLQPVEGRNGIQGRHCQHGMQPARVLSRTGNIGIEAESATDHGVLVFFIPNLNLQQFMDAGLRMQGEERRFGTLHCRLTLTDTTESSVTQEFELQEA